MVMESPQEQSGFWGTWLLHLLTAVNLPGLRCTILQLLLFMLQLATLCRLLPLPEKTLADSSDIAYPLMHNL